MSKLRVWWIPQVGVSKTFYIPVESPEEGKKVMDMLAAYDMFQLQENLNDFFSRISLCGVDGVPESLIHNLSFPQVRLE